MSYLEGLTLANYATFRTSDGQPIGNRSYQNFFIAEPRTWNGRVYQFAPFSIDGEQVSNALAGSRATLVAPSNVLTQAFMAEAALNRWLLQVDFVVILVQEGAVAPIPSEASVIASDLWMCSGYRSSDADGSVQMELASSLDAVEARTPNCVLQDWQVGSLPVTGVLLLT